MSFLGFFGFLGRSHDLRQLDAALRAFDLHPRIVPEAVKLALLRLVKDTPQGDDFRPAASLLAYCMLGPQGFAHANGEEATLEQEARIERALAAGQGTDAEIVLLALHAKVVQPSVVDLFDLRSEQSG
ncbi:hypothetical protein [Lutibaculum baratangense]|uniref:Uncharacterized protein n=1 Tax=Lutibaculum baratangense AMV1 TaxID=631454 RepID=V4R937_9HYPH|nr:hypothetical protein [Lutibaculum baratangense]ESR22711.1 hypothetical protein N177_3848 [Lutibaculum baratangense AMV1]